MELTIDKRKNEINTKNNLGLSFWDLCFWQNNPMQVNKESEVANRLRALIDMELTNLYAYAKPENFTINQKNNPDLDRYVERNLRINQKHSINLEQTIQNEKRATAIHLAGIQLKEYKSLVETLQKAKYPPSFQWLILNEALSNTYDVDFSKAKPQTIVNARVPHQTVKGLSNLPTEVLEFIYQNAPKYTSFKTLYKDAQVYYKENFLKDAQFENVETFGKGHWVRFVSGKNDELHFEQNVNKLKAATVNTPWCTKSEAGVQLGKGDFFIFFDNDNKARVAVRMEGEKINQTRGIQGGYTLQEVEREYNDVAMEFLKANQDFKDADKWLQKQIRNQKLIDYKEKIDSGNFSPQETEDLLNTLYENDYKAFGKNTYYTELGKSLPKILPYLAEQLNCGTDEICCTDFVSENESEICPYVYILGNGEFKKTKSTGKLTQICGNANFYESPVQTLGDITYIKGNLDLSYSDVADLGQLRYIGGDFSVPSNISSLKNIEYVGGTLNLGKNVADLGALTEVGILSLDYYESKLTSLGNLKKHNLNLTLNGKITDLGALEEVGGSLDVSSSKINDLQNLKSIKTIKMEDGQITKADNLEKLDKLVLIDSDTETKMTAQQFKQYIAHEQESIMTQ